MTKLPAFLLIIAISIFTHKAKAQSFTFAIVSPGAGQAADSTLPVAVRFYASTYEISTIVAVTEGRTVTLNNGGSNGTYFSFTGSINLSGLAQGSTYKLKVTCRDVLGNEKSDSVNYKYAKSPQATIVYPEAGSNVFPSLRIKTSHTGFDTCTSVVNVIINGQTVFADTSVYNDIDTTIMLNTSLNGYGYVDLIVKDKWNRQKTAYAAIAADYLNYLYLTPVYTGTGKILDYNYNKILEARSDAVYIVDSGFQTASAIPGTYTIPSRATLTPFGAYWYGHEWTNGTTYIEGYDSVAGKYGTYRKWDGTYYRLYRRDLETRVNTQINYSIDPIGFSYLGNDGTAYFLAGYNNYLGKFVNNSLHGVNGTNRPEEFQLLDFQGDSALYFQLDYTSWYNCPIYFTGGIIHDTLNTIVGFGTNDSLSHPCLIAGKYITYPKYGATGKLQVWVRDSTGNSTQRTFFNSNSFLKAINAAGDIMFVNSNNLYFLKKDSINPRQIGQFIARPFYKDNTWYLINNHSLYKINVNAYRTAAAGNWSNPASWQNGAVPLANADVIVDTNIVVDTNVTCNTLKVVPPGSITVLPGVNLAVLH